MKIQNKIELEKEYERRAKDGVVTCIKCVANNNEDVLLRRERTKKFKAFSGKDDGLTHLFNSLPFLAGYMETNCLLCGKVFPKIEYEDVEF